MPRVTAYGPPWAMTSSPRTIIVSSRAISSCRASRKASRMLIFGMSYPSPLGILVRINVLVQLIWRGIGAALRKAHRFLDVRGDALLNRLILGICQDPGLLHVGCQALDGVTLPSPVRNFLAAPIHLWVAEVMSMEAVRLALQQRWPLTPSRPRNGFPSRFIHSQSVHAVDLHARNAVGRCHVGDIGDQRHVLLRRPLGILVVLTDIHHRQFPDRADVDIFVERPPVCSAIPKEAHGHLA